MGGEYRQEQMIEVTEKQSATKATMTNVSKAGCPSRVGNPVCCTPPGTAVAEENAAVAIRAATTKHDREVFVSQFPPSLTGDSWFWVIISRAVCPLLLHCDCEKKPGSIEVLTN